MSDQVTAAPVPKATAPTMPSPPERPRPSSGGDTVAIGCKLPSGFVLQLFEMEPVYEPILGGGMRETKRARRVGEEYPLNGYGFNILEASKGKLPEHLIIGGYGITTGVPREVWDKWLLDNKDSALVKNKVIFVANTIDAARGMATEQAAIKSGFEAIDPDNPGAKSMDFRNVRKGTTNNNDVDNL